MTGYPQQGIWGKPELVMPANPAAGANFQLTVPAGESWWFWCIANTLTTGAAAANRVSLVQAEDGAGKQIGAIPHGLTQTANLTKQYLYGLGLPSSAAFEVVTAGVLERAFVRLPRWLLPPGSVLFIVVLNIQAADQISGISYVISRSYL